MSLSHSTLLKLIDYNHETGMMHWRARTADFFSSSEGKSAAHNAAAWNARYAGTPALNAITKCGYKRGFVLSRKYLAHRVAWMIVEGEWPEHQIDHINGDRADNRIANLRLATREENARNRGGATGTSSKFCGVSLCRRSGRWYSKISIGGRHIYLGRFESEIDAAKAYDRRAKELFGEYARLNFASADLCLLPAQGSLI